MTLKLAAIEPIRRRARSSSGSFWLEADDCGDRVLRIAAGRGLALELDDETGRLRSSPEIKSRFQNLSGAWPGVILPKEETSRQLFLADDGGSRYLPIRIIRHERACCTTRRSLAAKVSPRSVEVLERTTISVRHGELELGPDSGSGCNSPTAGSWSTGRRSTSRS